MTRRRLIPMLLPIAVVAAACGQKSGVSDDADGAVAPPPAATQPPATQPPGETVEPGDTTTPGTGAGTTPVGTGTPTTATPATGPATGPYTPGDDDTAGVSDTEIVIGIHAPVTGASPIPQETFDIGKDIYWKWLAESAPDRLFGRTVKVVFRDDEFNPQHAVQVCQEMVEEDGAFLLVGAAGADQITACAQYANDAGIPYLSAGVNTEELTGLDTYFAFTMTYAEQAPLIVDQLTSEDFTQAALLISDTPSFQDFGDAMRTAAEEGGIELIFDEAINKNASPAEAATVAQQLKDSGAEAVIYLGSPTVYVTGLAAAAANQSYNPRWIGPGVSNGLNAVTNFGCPNVGNGEFFSPTPGLDVIDELDADFRKAYPQYANAEADDIGLQLWSLNKTLALLFEATGAELGRAAFMNALVTQGPFDNGIYPPIELSAEDHFGGTGAHLLRANCDAKVYDTAAQFVQAG